MPSASSLDTRLRKVAAARASARAQHRRVSEMSTFEVFTRLSQMAASGHPRVLHILAKAHERREAVALAEYA